jgi:hypothetical protein
MLVNRRYQVEVIESEAVRATLGIYGDLASAEYVGLSHGELGKRVLITGIQSASEEQAPVAACHWHYDKNARSWISGKPYWA